MSRCVAIVFCVSVFFCGSARATQYDVYLLGGQSNGAGRGDSAEIPEGSVLANPQDDVLFYWHKTLTTKNGNLTQDQFVDLQPGAGQGRTAPAHDVEFGAELSLGRTLADAYPNRNILIVKYCHGGSNLHTQWAEDGRCYNTFVDTVQAALDKLDDNGDTYTMRGMAWMQGESDTNAAHANAYQDNLVDLIRRVREDLFDDADAPFVLTGLSDNQYSNPQSDDVQTVIAAQTNVPNLVANVAFVDTDDDTLFTTYDSAPIHFDANGQINLGNALGKAFVSLDTP